MKQGWEIKKLGEVCEKITDGSHNPPKGVVESGYLMLSSKNILDDSINYEDPRLLTEKDFSQENKRTQVSFGDVLLTIVGTIGRTAIVPEIYPPFTLQRSVAVLKTNRKQLYPRFLMYSLQNSLSDLVSEARGVAQKGLYLNQIKEFPILLPPFPEQLRIVSILDKAFVAVANAKANAEQNLINAKELFESYLQSVFEIKGENWEEKKIGEICELKPQKKEARDKLRENELVTFLPMEDLGVLNKEIIGVKERQLKDVTGSYTYFADNDVLLAKITPCFENGKIGIARNLINGIGFGSSEYIVFRSKGSIEPEFLYYFLSRKQIREEGKKLMSGAVGHKRVSKDWIENYIIPFPKSKSERQSIVAKLDALSAETKRLEAIYQQKIVDLEELKKSVLQMAFCGELT